MTFWRRTANPFAERLIGSIRRDCLNHVVVFGEQHLRRVLTSYCAYYHGSRTYLSLAKDAPTPPTRAGCHRGWCDRSPGSRRLAPPLRTTRRLTNVVCCTVKVSG